MCFPMTRGSWDSNRLCCAFMYIDVLVFHGAIDMAPGMVWHAHTCHGRPFRMNLVLGRCMHKISCSA